MPARRWQRSSCRSAPDPALLVIADLEDFLFEAFAFRDVAHQAGENAALADVGRAHRQVHREFRAVLASAAHFAPDPDDAALACLMIMIEVAVVLRAVWLRHEHRDVVPDHFLRGITEDALGGGIDRLDDAAFIDRDDAVDGGVDDPAQTRRGIEKLALKLQTRDGGSENVADRFQKVHFLGAEDAEHFAVDTEDAKRPGATGNDDCHAADHATVAHEFRQAQTPVAPHIADDDRLIQLQGPTHRGFFVDADFDRADIARPPARARAKPHRFSVRQKGKDGAEIDLKVLAQDVGGVVKHGLDIASLERVEAEAGRDGLFARAPLQLRGWPAAIATRRRFRFGACRSAGFLHFFRGRFITWP